MRDGRPANAALLRPRFISTSEPVPQTGGLPRLGGLEMSLLETKSRDTASRRAAIDFNAPFFCNWVKSRQIAWARRRANV